MRWVKTLIGACAALAMVAMTSAPALANDDDTFSANELTNAVSDFFGVTTEAAAKVVQRIFRDQGQPDAYIKGDEGSGAVVVGLRYGEGWLVRKNQEPVKVYWKGPSVGFDVGGNASKSFTLVYNLKREERIYQRFPGVEGSYYFVAGYRRELSAQRWRDGRADAHRAWAARRRERALPGLFAQARLVPVLGRKSTRAGQIPSRDHAGCV